MTDTDTITTPGGTSALTYTCWGLRYDNGQDALRPDYMPHYRNEADAANDAGEHVSDRWGTPTPYRLDSPCFLAVARCGYVFDQENAGESHHETAEDAYRCAIDSGFTDLGNGELRCSADCDQGCNEDD